MPVVPLPQTTSVSVATFPDPILGDSIQRTDPSGWRLVVGEDSHGQHKWVYLPDTDPRRQSWEQSKEDKYWLGLETGNPELPRATNPLEAAANGYAFYRTLQSSDGHFSGEYGGPLFLIPGLVIGLYVTGRTLREEQRVEIIRYLMRRRKKEGGWGLHQAAPPTMFGTAMNYVALRLLGMSADHPAMLQVREWISKNGGALGVPSWGKAWLSILGVYEWEGLNPVPPELWMAPEWVPIHPWRWWIHTRNVYIPLSYLYAKRFVGEITPLVEEIRQEIYNEPYDNIDFSRHRNNVCPLDLYSPHHTFLNVLNEFLAVFESCGAMPPLRRAAIRRVYKLCVYEDENTGYQTIGPVSKMFNLLVRYVEDGPESDAFAQHLAKIDDFLWMSEEGLMMTGTNGSQLWDASFISQALVETGLADREENKESVRKLLDWLDKAQIRDDPKHYKTAYRHSSKGAWPFSTPQQSYTVSDCAAEGMKAVLGLQSLSYTEKPVTERRLKDCVDVLLTMQNKNGGFASYELVRGTRFMELLNCAEVFGNIMIEYNYPECTTSALSALMHFSRVYPDYRRAEIDHTVKRAIEFIHSVQQPDGSWFGSWGVCFTYATMFALESLSLVGESFDTSERVRRACQFLSSKQMEDGGWGETYMSCVSGKYSQHEKSQVVQTAWAVLALIYAKYPNKKVIRQAVELIMSRQQPNGSWLQEDVEGIFNKNCGINYPNFKFSFTIWALGRAAAYLDK